jgi:iron-sulfur cluster assembly accessory protein
VITLTDTASVKVKELISQEGQEGLMLRVAVRPGGCSGFSYEMFFDTEKDAEDMVLDQLGVAVVVGGAITNEVVIGGAAVSSSARPWSAEPSLAVPWELSTAASSSRRGR